MSVQPSLLKSKRGHAAHHQLDLVKLAVRGIAQFKPHTRFLGDLFEPDLRGPGDAAQAAKAAASRIRCMKHQYRPISPNWGAQPAGWNVEVISETG